MLTLVKQSIKYNLQEEYYVTNLFIGGSVFSLYPTCVAVDIFLLGSHIKGLNTICTSNSMGRSEIWDKYHECCIGNGDKFHEAKPSEIYHFKYNKSGIYPKFHCYPCYSQLIPYSLHICMLCISFAMYAICHYVLNMLLH